MLPFILQRFPLTTKLKWLLGRLESGVISIRIVRKLERFVHDTIKSPLQLYDSNFKEMLVLYSFGVPANC